MRYRYTRFEDEGIGRNKLTPEEAERAAEYERERQRRVREWADEVRPLILNTPDKHVLRLRPEPTPMEKRPTWDTPYDWTRLENAVEMVIGEERLSAQWWHDGDDICIATGL
jgi:hypothetical protein